MFEVRKNRAMKYVLQNICTFFKLTTFEKGTLVRIKQISENLDC